MSERYLLAAWMLLLPMLGIAQATVENYSHGVDYASSLNQSADYELGLGALDKIGGRWRFKHSERIKGELARHTWQVVDGYTSIEAFEWYAGQLDEFAEPIFSCQGRSCGRSAQWADRVFKQRVLYGHDEGQRYAVWRHEHEGSVQTYVLYAADRGNRHYVHLDTLKHD
jgi:hypothetical protein